MTERVVIIGAGHAGCHLAFELRQKGFEGSVTILGDEDAAPYQRPPLSKGRLDGGRGIEALGLRPRKQFEDRKIDLRTGTRVHRIDRSAHRVEAEGGEKFAYDHLILATGSRNRDLPFIKKKEGVLSLRTLADAQDLGGRLGESNRLAIIGAGFIGLEIAAMARACGTDVTVLEQAPRALGRAVSRVMADALTDCLRAEGVEFRFGTEVAGLTGDTHVTGLVLANGGTVPADTVLIAVGVIPNTELAEAAGLPVENGIIVDDHLRTDDPTIWAIGDCASFSAPSAAARIRLESVQNANDQARAVTAAILGQPVPYAAVPWFWSDQGDRKLQIAGLSHPEDDVVLRGDPNSNRFAVARLHRGRMTALETLNMPGEHLAARRLLAKPPRVNLTLLKDPNAKLLDVAIHAPERDEVS